MGIEIYLAIIWVILVTIFVFQTVKSERKILQYLIIPILVSSIFIYFVFTAMQGYPQVLNKLPSRFQVVASYVIPQKTIYLLILDENYTDPYYIQIPFDPDIFKELEKAEKAQEQGYNVWLEQIPGNDDFEMKLESIPNLKSD